MTNNAQQTLVVDTSNFCRIDGESLTYFDTSLDVWYSVFIQIFIDSFNEDEEHERLSTFMFESREHVEHVNDIEESDLNEANERFLRANEAILDSYFSTTRCLANVLVGYKVNRDDYVVDDVRISLLDPDNILITIDYTPYDRAHDPDRDRIVQHFKDKMKTRVANRPRIYQPFGLL